MRRVMTGSVLFLLAAAVYSQQEEAPKPAEGPVVMQNTGTPIKVPFTCSEEDIIDAGMSCSAEEPCAVYLELVSVEFTGNQIIAAGNLHSSSATLYSILLTSPDGGKTWREPMARVKGAGLEQIRFYGFENGWISGQTLLPLPRDPFLLMTRDGGKSWTRKAIFDDARAGTILQFWFDSATAGGLVIDRGQSADGARYEMYESPNGGETWMVREASEKPFVRKRASADVAAIRIRTDEKAKAYRIERNEAGKWNTIAAFLINVDPCKPVEHELKPPPEEAPPESGPLVIPSDPAKRRKPPTLKKD